MPNHISSKFGSGCWSRFLLILNQMVIGGNGQVRNDYELK